MDTHTQSIETCKHTCKNASFYSFFLFILLIEIDCHSFFSLFLSNSWIAQQLTMLSLLLLLLETTIFVHWCGNISVNVHFVIEKVELTFWDVDIKVEIR